MKMKFKDLKVGDTFRFGSVEFVKLGDNIYCGPTPTLDRQMPNCMELSKSHYCVVSANSIVTKLKSMKEYYDPYGISDYCDKEEKVASN